MFDFVTQIYNNLHHFGKTICIYFCTYLHQIIYMVRQLVKQIMLQLSFLFILLQVGKFVND